jgi:AcrR family transcriptional regulator
MNKTKEKIIDTALSLFMTHGYSVGINEIIQKSGTSKGALYHYFKSKENLLDESMEQFFSIANCELNTPESSNQTFRVKIENIIFKAFSPFNEFSKKFPSAKNLNYLKIISEYPNHETLRQKNAEYFKRFTSMLKKIIDEEISKGRLSQKVNGKILSYNIAYIIQGSIVNSILMLKSMDHAHVMCLKTVNNLIDIFE